MNPNIKAITLHVEDSAVLREIKYIISKEKLYLEFTTGVKFVYNNVPVSVFIEFMDAESLGSYFNKYFKDTYEGVQAV